VNEWGQERIEKSKSGQADANIVECPDEILHDRATATSRDPNGFHKLVKV
jgi:hypothetical protein